MEPELIGSGAQASVFRVGSRAVKRYTLEKPAAEIYYEALAGQLAFDAGLPVPRVLRVTSTETESSIEFSLIKGRSIGSLVQDGLQSDGSWIKPLAQLHWQIHSAAVAMPRSLRDYFRRAILSVRMFDDDLRRWLLDRLDELPHGTALCHGDFHFGNVLVADESLVVIDWGNASFGPAAADVCQTFVLLHLYCTRQAEAYLAVYCELVAIDPEWVRAWLPVVIGARLALHIDNEIQPLLKLLNTCRV